MIFPSLLRIFILPIPTVAIPTPPCVLTVAIPVFVGLPTSRFLIDVPIGMS